MLQTQLPTGDHPGPSPRRFLTENPRNAPSPPKWRRSSPPRKPGEDVVHTEPSRWGTLLLTACISAAVGCLFCVWPRMVQQLVPVTSFLVTVAMESAVGGHRLRLVVVESSSRVDADCRLRHFADLAWPADYPFGRFAF